MKNPDYTPKTDIEEYFYRLHNFIIYTNINSFTGDWKGLFDPLDFLNLIYEKYELVKINKDKPKSIIKAFHELGFDDRKYYYFLQELIELIDEEKHQCGYWDTPLKICYKLLKHELNIAIGKAIPKLYRFEDTVFDDRWDEFDIYEVRGICMAMDDEEEMIHYLQTKKNDYLLKKDTLTDPPDIQFEKACDLEMEKIEYELKFKSSTKLATNNQSNYILSSKKGNKANLIRILLALHQQNIFQKRGGDFPGQDEFINHVGSFFGLDLINYDTDLYQAFNATIETNLQIFKKMGDSIEKEYNKRLNKS